MVLLLDGRAVLLDEALAWVRVWWGVPGGPVLSQEHPDRLGPRPTARTW